MGSSVILPTPGQPKQGPDPSFVSGSVPNVATFAWQGISPPSAIYIQRDDVLNVLVISSQASEVVTVNLRLLLVPNPSGGQPDKLPPHQPAPTGPNNTIVTISQQIPVQATPRNGTILNIPLTEGYLLSVGVGCSQAVTRGQTYVTAQLIRGSATNLQTAYKLFGDYLSNNLPIGWPGGRQQSDLEGPGWRHSINVANPAAGADWTFQCANRQRVVPVSFSAAFSTSAAAANRNIELFVDDGANTVWRTSAAASVLANTIQIVSGTTSNNPPGVVTTDFSLLFPPGLILASLWRLRTVTANIQAADQWSNIWLNVDELLELG